MLSRISQYCLIFIGAFGLVQPAAAMVRPVAPAPGLAVIAVAMTEDDVAARMNALGIKAMSQDVTAANLKDVTYIGLYSDQAKAITDEDCDAIGALPALYSFSFSNGHFNSHCLAAIAGNKALRTLALSYAEVDGSGLSALGAMDDLTDLSLGYSKGFTAADLGFIKDMGALTRLDLMRDGLDATNPITDEVVDVVSSASTIQSLWLDSAGISDAALEKIAAMPSLTEVSLRATPITDAGLDKLAAAPALGRLTLSGIKTITPAGLQSIANLKQLRYLNLYGTPVAGGIAALSAMPALAELEISGTGATDADMAGLAGAAELSILAAHDNPALTDASAAALKDLPKLSSLALTRSAITDAAFKSFHDMKSLTYLFVSGTKSGDAGAEALVGSAMLKSVEMQKTGITDAGLLSLSKIPTLTSISLYETAVTDAGVAAAKAVLPKAYISK